MVHDFFLVRGLNVMMAFNGEMAQEILDRFDVKLIFLDLRMAGVDGRTFFKYLRNTGIDIPVIVLTGYPEEIVDLEDEAFELAGFFSKPYKLEELLEQTKEVLKLS